MFEENLSECIKKGRKRAGLTQQQLADKLGISLMTILRWEKGVRAPNSAILPKLAKELNISVDELMGLDIEPEKSEVKATDDEDSTELGFWGTVADKARKLARIGNSEDISAALFMLKMAVSSLDKAAAV